MNESIQQQLLLFFPGQSFSDQEVKEGLDKGEILTEQKEILPLLQTALIDDKMLEIELDGKPRVYFSRLKDDPPDETDIEVDEDIVLDDFEYIEADYLKTMSHIVTLPLEPGLGNLHLRYSRFIILRMFTNTYAVEFCTTFEAQTKVGDLPVLRLVFPSLARIVRNARKFRAKVPDIMDFTVVIEMNKALPLLTTTPLDISINSISVSVSQDEQKLFSLDSVHSLKLNINDELVAGLKGTVKHLSKVRKKGGIEYVCGLEFDLETPALAAIVESTVASVQRAHIKALNEKSDVSGIKLIA